MTSLNKWINLLIKNYLLKKIQGCRRLKQCLRNKFQNKLTNFTEKNKFLEKKFHFRAKIAENLIEIFKIRGNNEFLEIGAKIRF